MLCPFGKPLRKCLQSSDGSVFGDEVNLYDGFTEH
eukprot:CAMPEP_0175821482 /NCGR_PEP_ID=MMETSP0107_2-20121207/9164_1 /TAXON_ID=195067 ORGANISM="Goniomonas pacifica, Strain CCMP1869" /NCGR_SAMPLE_ID=MMETSP0107_2 /ASSEMBLY_ACC=CAM_ASM_000203 /LENGTH=34 /DNA_ID= /DNA_START= /DNA_END= /DNA_ORIENTATION=